MIQAGIAVRAGEDEGNLLGGLVWCGVVWCGVGYPIPTSLSTSVTYRVVQQWCQGEPDQKEEISSCQGQSCNYLP